MASSRARRAAGARTCTRAAVGTFLAALGERVGGSLTIEIEMVVANDEHAVVLTHQSPSHKGRTLDAHNIDLYTIRDGQIVGARSTSFNLEAGEAFYV